MSFHGEVRALTHNLKDSVSSVITAVNNYQKNNKKVKYVESVTEEARNMFFFFRMCALDNIVSVTKSIRIFYNKIILVNYDLLWHILYTHTSTKTQINTL